MTDRAGSGLVARLAIIIGLALGALSLAVFVSPIAQDPAYHAFADQRTILGIPHFWNVASNLPFLIVGLYGLKVLAGHTPAGALQSLHVSYVLIFAGVALVALGSGYYHLDPANETLMWDRLPMSVAFMAFFSMIAGECISEKFGRRLLWPLLAVGLWSVVYWYFTELQGRGDLRAYALVQFLPMLLIPVILMLFRSSFMSNKWIWLGLAAYLLSKLFEFADAAVFDAIGFGGHAFKHLFGALGSLCILVALLTRVKRSAVLP